MKHWDGALCVETLQLMVRYSPHLTDDRAKWRVLTGDLSLQQTKRLYGSRRPDNNRFSQKLEISNFEFPTCVRFDNPLVGFV